ncbi:MAG: GNAT family N-acetyltransferase [Promethearchaeota archaeon]
MAQKEEIKDDMGIDHYTFISGTVIDLCAMHPNHAELYARWKNDPIGRRYARNVIPRTLDEQKKRFEQRSETFRDHISMEIWHKKDSKPIGTIGLGHIDWVSGWANAYIWIGDKNYWGKNIATEATKLLLEYAFIVLNLNKIHGGVAVDNIGSWSVAEKLGFTLEGIERETLYIDGKYLDNKTFCLLREDWEKHHTEENLE